MLQDLPHGPRQVGTFVSVTSKGNQFCFRELTASNTADQIGRENKAQRLRGSDRAGISIPTSVVLGRIRQCSVCLLCVTVNRLLSYLSESLCLVEWKAYIEGVLLKGNECV